MNLFDQIEPLLLKVQKPARYIGGEPGSIMKDKSGIKARFAFCFPDRYDVGMSNLGMKKGTADAVPELFWRRDPDSNRG